MAEPYKTILKTERLILRHQVIEGLDDLWALYCNPRITQFIPDAPRSREEAREDLEWHMHSRGSEWHLLTAGAFVSMALPLLVFFSMQRFFVCGLLAGSVKG